MRKQILLSLLIILTTALHGQRLLPKGVVPIGPASPNISFLLKDRKNILWEGATGKDMITYRKGNGLRQFKNNQWISIDTVGIYTDVLEVDTLLYFATSDGLMQYNGLQFKLDKGIKRVTSLAYFENKLMIGTEGNGLYEKTNTGFKRDSIKINGRFYDSIYCMTTKGGVLWIGTSNGLVKYDGSQFSQYSLPITNTKDWKYNNNQRSIKSIQIDADDRVWVLNKNYNDSIDCIYVFENGGFQSGRNHYESQCLTKVLFPYSANKLALDKSGHVIIGMGWGVLRLGKDSITSYLLDFPIFDRDYSKVNSSAYYSYADRDGIIYTNLYNFGYVTIDNDKFDNRELLADGRMAINRMDINDIKATISNVGIHFPVGNFKNPTLNLPNFEIPSIGCATPVFSGAIWMGGKDDNGDLHVSAETYRQSGYDYKPGPIDLITKVYDSLANVKYNKIWRMDRQTIDQFLKNRKRPFYIIPKSILEWPAHGSNNFDWHMAPFVDVNQNDLYEPEKGDYPKIKGDQMLWWVFNDLGAHTESKGKALGVEIRGSCYAYSYRDLPTTDTNAIINRTLFFDYQIINRSETDYNDFYVGLWTDPDLGNYVDDYLGVDSINNTGYCYNGDNYDEGRMGYGKNPPVFFCKMLNKKINSFFYYNNNSDPINGNPDKPAEYYKYMTKQFLFKTKEYKWVKTKSGKDTIISFLRPLGRICKDTMFIYTDGNSASDRRLLMSSYLPSFKKDSIYDIEFAYTLLHDPNIDFLTQACDMPINTMRRIQNWYDHHSFPSKPYYGTQLNTIQNLNSNLEVYPNPTNSSILVNSSIENNSIISFELTDMNGKVLCSKSDFDTEGYFHQSIEMSNYSIGLYFLLLKTNNGQLSKKIIKL